jgi:hypothetical protein
MTFLAKNFYLVTASVKQEESHPEFLCSVDETILLDCDADCDSVKQKKTVISL